MNQHAWYEHFKEQLQGLTESFEHSGAQGSLLKYALQEQRLNPEQYLTWAMTHYLLPKLQPRFFTETPISQEMFAKWATHYPWSEECLPVAEWDGSIIVACLQPPQDFPSNPTSIFVLATPDSLREAWQSLHRQTKTSGKTQPEVDLNPVLANESSSEHSAQTNVSIKIQGSQEEMPEGLFDVATVVKLKPLENGLFKTSEDIEQGDTKIEENTISIVDSPKQSKNTIEKTVIATMPRPRQATKPKQTPILTDQFTLNKIKAQNPELMNENTKKVLTEMKDHFQKALILTMDENETQLTAFAWDESFQKTKDASMQISLEKPSIFSIVAKTQKPFHGYISLNEINEQFFENWNQGQIPDHVTITPLIVDDHMIGMVLGIGEKSTYNKAALKFAEQLSEKFVSTLKTA